MNNKFDWSLVPSLLANENLLFDVSAAGAVTVNNASATAFDITTTNGVVHVVASVISRL